VRENRGSFIGMLVEYLSFGSRLGRIKAVPLSLYVLLELLLRGKRILVEFFELLTDLGGTKYLVPILKFWKLLRRWIIALCESSKVRLSARYCVRTMSGFPRKYCTLEAFFC